MAFFHNAQNVDVRYGTFNKVAGDQTNYNDRPPGEAPVGLGQDDLERADLTQAWGPEPKPTVDFSGHINDEWDVCIHPDGWKYFYRAGLITEHEHVAKQSLSLGLLRELPGDYYEEVLSSMLKSSPVSKRIYVNHALWYASPDKDAATRTDHTLQEASVLRIAYWDFMCRYPSHRPLHPSAESAARDYLSFYIQEGLRWKSASRMPFPLEECRELLDFLEKLNKEDQCLDMSSPAAHPLSQSSARTAFVSWILLHVAHHSKTVHFGLKPQTTQVRRLGRLWSILISFFLSWYPFYRRKCVVTVQKNSMLQHDQKGWSTYIESLVSTRSTFNSVATVLLIHIGSSVSIGIISIPCLDTVTHITALLSVVLTLGSITMTTYLRRRHGSGVTHNAKSEERGSAVILVILFVSLTWRAIRFSPP